jgi:hypothetical protein
LVLEGPLATRSVVDSPGGGRPVTVTRRCGGAGGDGPTDLAVGAPGENFGAIVDAGAVSVFFGTASGTGLPSASQTLVQDNVEAGDQFGAALDV